MKNWKIPGMGNIQKKQELLVKEKFEDKSKFMLFQIKTRNIAHP